MSKRISRRQFAGTVAGTASLIAGTTEPLPAGQKDAAAVAKPEDTKSTLDLLTQIALQEFPHAKLDAAAIEEIRSDVRSNLSRGKVLSAFPLTNADEPGFIFAAWRKD